MDGYAMLRLMVLGVLVAGAACFFRYDISSRGPAVTYVLDRWTGEMSFCQGPRCFPVQTAAATPDLFADLIPAKEQ